MFKQVTLTNKCLAIVMQRCEAASGETTSPENGFRIFGEFQEENRASFWNPGLVQSVEALEFVGFVRPGTLFVSATTDLHAECLRGAWARRVLKPPPGYTIRRLGDIGGIEMQEVPQTQFIPLAEVLCLLVSNLNRAGEPATLDKIVSSLADEYEGMRIPKQEVLYATLGALIAEGKLCCMGEHYFLPTPQMFRHYQREFLGRPSGTHPTAYLRSKEPESKWQETCSRECQTGASVACGQAPYVPPAANKKDQATSVETQPAGAKEESRGRNSQSRTAGSNKEKFVANKENKGFLSRLFGRPKSKHATDESCKPVHDGDIAGDPPCTSVPARGQVSEAPPPAANVPVATFSAQFPPPEWLCDPRFVKPPTAVKDAANSQQAFLSKIRRTSKDPRAELQAPGGRTDDPQRQSVWLVDPTEGGRAKMPPVQFNRRERSNEPSRRVFASQRYHESSRHHHHQLSPTDHYYERTYQRGSKQRHRLSKYLSSSSECLREVPYQPKKGGPEERRRGSSRNHHHHDRPQHHSVYQFPRQPATLDHPPPTPRLEEEEDKGQQTIVAPPNPPFDEPRLENESDRTHRTSTPTPKDKDKDKELPPQPEPTGRHASSGGQRDSAYGASPVATEMSGSEGKYSSSGWSGSGAATSPEAPDPPSAAAAQQHRVDNTYVNDTRCRADALDHTYENLDHGVDETTYEDVTCDKPTTLQAHVSSV